MNGALIRGSKTTRCRSSGQLSSRLLASGRRVSQDANGACKRAAWKGWAGSTRLAVVRRASAKDQEVDYKQRRKGHCYGCGVLLQTDEAGAVGYVAPEKYEVKRTHRQLDQLLCERCVALTHGQMVPAVEDFVQRQQSHAEASGSSSGDAGGQVLELAGRRLLTPEQLRDQLKAVRERKVLVVLVIDVLDASGSFLNRVRDLVGANPIILVATKVDLLPRGTAMADVHQWLLGIVEGKRVSVVDVLCLSSKHKQGVDEALSSILQSRQGRDVFVLGAANTGKSAFVRTLLQEMSRFSSHHYDPAAAATGRYLPVESAMPGTTLGLVPLKAFKSGGHLFDTPGLHLGHRLPHLLTPGELKHIHPVKKLRPFVAPSPLEIAAGLGEPLEGDTVTATYCWGAVARIDVVTAPPQAVLAFYSPPALQVYSMGLLQADDQVVFESPVAPADSGAAAAEEEVLFGSGSVQQRGGLRVVREATVAVRGGRGAICDIALSGLCGWVTVYAPGGSGDLSLRILAPKGIEAYVRRPLPVPNPVTTARIW